MDKRILVVIGVACALAGGLAWWLAQTPGAEKRQEREPDAPEVASRAPTSRGALDALSKATPPRRAADVEGGTESAAASKPDGQRRKLRVVLAANDAPAAGATVEFEGIDSESQIMVTEEQGRAAARPATLVADSGGLVELPPFRLAAVVSGRLGELRGQALLAAIDLEPPVLRLKRGLTVLVVDAAGAPQEGVPVALLEAPGAQWGLAHETTGTNGIATLMAPDRPKVAGGSPRGGCVALAIPLADRVEKPCDPENPPAGPIELVLPPTCRVLVELIRPDGTPFTEPAEVGLWLRHEDQDRMGPPFGTLDAPAAGGTATFPRVGLTGTLQARGTPGAAALRSAEATSDGPRAAGAKTRITVTCGRLATVVTGRLVDAAGKPVSNVTLSATLPGGENPFEAGRHIWLETPSPEGRFSLRFDVDPATVEATAITLGVDEQTTLAVGHGVLHPTAITVPLPPTIRSGTADVGDVVVPRLDVLAAGMVVTEDGTPVPGAELRLMERGWTSWTSTYAELQGMGSDAEGRFEIKGTVKKRGLGLVARQKGVICLEPTPFKRGDRDLRVVMTLAGGLEGSLKNHGGKGWRLYDRGPLELRVTGGKADLVARNLTPHEGGPGLFLVVEDDGAFRTEELPPGTYSVQISSRDSPEPLLVIPDVVVKAGEITRDPRLQGIDVSKISHQHVLTVVDERAKPIAGVKVAVVTGTGTRTSSTGRSFVKYETDSAGHATIQTRPDAFDAIIAKNGYQAVTVSGVDHDLTVTLHSAPDHAVMIKLADSVPIPEAPFSIKADLKWLCASNEQPPEDPDWGDPRNEHQARQFGKDHTVTIRVQNPGIYRVQLWLIKTEANSSGGGGLDQKGQAATVTVPEAGDVSIGVDVDPATLERDMAERKKRDE